MTNEKNYLKHVLYILSYVLVLGIEAYFVRSMKVLYSPYAYLGTLVILGLILNFAFLFVFKNSDKPLIALSLYQLIQAALAFLAAYFFFHLPWKESLAYPCGALFALALFAVIRSDLALRSALTTVLVAAGFTIALRLSSVSGGLLFAIALLNGFYLGSCQLKNNEIQKGFWQSALIFTAALALGRAAIQYYLVQSAYDSLGVVITHPYTFVGLFAGILIPPLYHNALKERAMGTVFGIIVLGILFPALLGVFIHVRPFAGYLLGFTISAFIAGNFLQAPFSLNILSYFTYAVGVGGLSVFALLSNLSRGIRLGILAGVFALSLIGYVVKSLIQKDKSTVS